MTTTTTTYFEQVPFEGTDAEREANRATHYFDSFDEGSGTRCMSCDCRPWGLYADYPCGAEIPEREVVMTEAEAEAHNTAVAEAWTAKARMHMDIDAMLAGIR